MQNKEFAEMLREDVEKHGEMTEDGRLALKGVKDIVPLEKKEEEIIPGTKIFTIEGQIESFYKTTPFFYNKAGLFYIWNDKDYKFENCDETDLLNGIADIGINTISSKTKTEVLNGLRQYGRRKIPKNPPNTWVQFKDKIIDFSTGEEFKASPEYFITNPIPWEIGNTDDVPTIEKLFLEWVGEKYVKTLYQIVGYCCSSNQFMQRLIALVGGGANGKGTFIKLLIKFLGLENVAASELKELSSNQFETSAIYKKLLCVMGEINYNDLKDTNQIKKLSGEDQVRYCFKGKTPFPEDTITTIISATNALPATPDKTIGFYRKWLIVDFPNQFSISHGLIESIPDVEFKNLAKKILTILKELYKTQKFENEGNFEERIVRYEERSNPVLRFVEAECEEKMGENTELRTFTNKFNEYAKKHHLRVLTVRQISKILREEGFEMGKRSVEIDFGNYTSRQVILNLSISLSKNTENTESCSQNPCEVSTKSFGISGIYRNEDNKDIGLDTYDTNSKKELVEEIKELKLSDYKKLGHSTQTALKLMKQIKADSQLNMEETK